MDSQEATGRETERVARLETALRVLARLVRDEFPAGYSLAQIAEIWGAATSQEIAALRTAEQDYDTTPNSV